MRLARVTKHEFVQSDECELIHYWFADRLDNRFRENLCNTVFAYVKDLEVTEKPVDCLVCVALHQPVKSP